VKATEGTTRRRQTPLPSHLRGPPGFARRVKRAIYNHVAAVLPPRELVTALREYPRFVRERRRYMALSGERLRWSDQLPQLLDRSATTPFDAHYEYQDAWAARRIFLEGPEHHVDVGSRISYVLGLTAFCDTTFVDIRPLEVSIPGFTSVAGDVLNLPFEDRSVASLSCLHVAEHVGLGRYGDPLDPDGTRKATRELARVLAPRGRLYFSLPVGRERTVFNAHRVHDPTAVAAMFPGLTLMACAGVDDGNRFLPAVEPAELRGQEYACGFFVFTRE
jgi:SAM-dependent methyltransferase